MELYAKGSNNGFSYEIYKGDSREMGSALKEESVDSIVTDPPYGLVSITKRFGKEGSALCKRGKDGSFARLSRGFMGKEWDGTGIEIDPSFWAECLKVLKPGGHLLAFGGSRTFHRIACAIEDAGFEIRDTIMWLYGSGFPKSHNVGLAVDRKLGVESKVVGKAYKKSSPLPSNHFGGTWADGSEDGEFTIKEATNEWKGWGTALKPAYEPIIVARKPLCGSVADNVLKYGTGAINIDGCRVGGQRFPANVITDGSEEALTGMPVTFEDGIAGCRYFYCAKASQKDRDEGLGLPAEKRTDGSKRANSDTGRMFGANSAPSRNPHPTVKPTKLMQYLVRLVTPRGGGCSILSRVREALGRPAPTRPGKGRPATHSSASRRPRTTFRSRKPG